jgi:hypothetical protein
MRWARHVGLDERREISAVFWSGNLKERKKLRGSPRFKGNSCIKMYCKGMRQEGADSIKLVENRDK